jgi:hypothetical protein
MFAMSYGNQGYEPGVGRTFTPSKKATWTEEFNELLNEGTFYSRNQLTEKLIEDGLRLNSPSNLTLKCKGLSSEQIKLLQSEQGQQILMNIINTVLGNGNSFPFTAPGINSDNLEEVKKQETKPQEQRAIQSENKQEKSPETPVNGETSINSAALKALNRMKKLKV